MKSFVIAIDGYSSCGKSTLAKDLARELRCIYIDSGAMYRAMALYFIKNRINYSEEAAIHSVIDKIKIEFKFHNDQNSIYLNGVDVSAEIRTMEVSDLVSMISQIPSLRTALVDQQRTLSEQGNIIMDGRDIGTKVFPNATVKFFMTADPKIRAERRFLELKGKVDDLTFEAVLNNLALRDHNDTTRAESPLICASDAIVIDNSNLTKEAQFGKILDILKPLLVQS